MAQSGAAKKGASAARGGMMLSIADGKKAEIGDTKGTGRESLSTEVVAELHAAICLCFNSTICVGGINYLCIDLSICLSLSISLSVHTCRWWQSCAARSVVTAAATTGRRQRRSSAMCSSQMPMTR